MDNPNLVYLDSSDDEESLVAKRARLDAANFDAGSILTHDGKPPLFWRVEKNKRGNPGYATNVLYLAWENGRKNWRVRWIVDGKVWGSSICSMRNFGSVKAAFDAACNLRRGHVKDGSGSTDHSVVCIGPVTGTILVDKCTSVTCTRTCVPIAEFAPDPRCTRDRFERFEFAVAAVADARSTYDERSEAWRTIRKLRKLRCIRCRRSQNSSNNSGMNNKTAAVKAMLQTIRDDLAKRPCATCGMYTRAMQCDHPGRTDKIGAVFKNPALWATKGGPDAVLREYQKTVPLCSFCHRLEKSHDTYNATDPTTLPADTWRQRLRKNWRIYRDASKKLNNQWKREVGKCYYCGRKVKEGEEHAFEWMHSRKKMIDDRIKEGLPPLRKTYDISRVHGSTTTRLFVLRAKPEIDDKCELGCANCHFIHETLPEQLEQVNRLEEFVARLDEMGGVLPVSDCF